MSSRTVAIIGAGPIGLAAAHSCLRRGYTPIVFERGERPGASLRRFGPTRFFSPLSMNLPPDLLALTESGSGSGSGSPDPSALLTGPEIATLLDRIAQSPILTKHVHCNHRVVRVTRHTFARGQHAGHPVRAELPFRLLVASNNCNAGDELFEADAVLDASGTYANPVPLVAAGAGAAGAAGAAGSSVFREDEVIRDLGTLHDRRAEIAGKTTLLIGHGHSAANAALVLEAVAREAPETRVIWAIHSRSLRPLAAVPSDPLPERARVVDRANALAQKPPPWLRIERAAFVESFARGVNDAAISVKLSGDRSIVVSYVVALIGYRPDLAPLSELPLEISATTEGAMRLWGALANVTDCLSVPKVEPKDLTSGEPRFHLVGAKSYGRARTFLLQTGYVQLETILDQLFFAS